MFLMGAVFAATHWLGGLATLLLVMLALAVSAHVAGNAIGTQLRDRADEQRRRPPPAHEEVSRLCEPETHLAERRPLGAGLKVAVVVGAALGALVGALVFRSLTRQPVEIGAGTLAFAAIGGMVGFIGYGFGRTMYSAWRQADRRE